MSGALITSLLFECLCYLSMLIMTKTIWDWHRDHPLALTSLTDHINQDLCVAFFFTCTSILIRTSCAELSLDCSSPLVSHILMTPVNMGFVILFIYLTLNVIIHFLHFKLRTTSLISGENVDVTDREARIGLRIIVSLLGLVIAIGIELEVAKSDESLHSIILGPDVTFKEGISIRSKVVGSIGGVAVLTNLLLRGYMAAFRRQIVVSYDHKSELKGMLLVALMLLSAPVAIWISLACGGSVFDGRRAIVFIFYVVIPLFVIVKDHRLRAYSKKSLEGLLELCRRRNKRKVEPVSNTPR